MDRSILKREFSGKKILILGLGREGLDTYRFLRKIVKKEEIGLADRLEEKNLPDTFQKIIKNDKRCRFFLGKNYLSAIKDYDLVVRAPGVPIHLPEIEKAYRIQKITSQSEIFLKYCPGIVIGVTGTKGKSTTSSLIFSILKEAGFKAKLLGNIGKPMLSFLLTAENKDYFVCELSSHQLYKLKYSPHIAIVTNIYREHLDYYKSFSEYISAKANIFLHQNSSDLLIYHSSFKELDKLIARSKASKIAYNKENYDFSSQKIKLLGDFNRENAKIAAIAARWLKIRDAKIYDAIVRFRPLPHRLEYVGKYCGIDFYNDSLSTIPESAQEAIKTLGGRVETLFAGGHERNQKYRSLAKAILKSQINFLVLFPETGSRIWQEIKKEAKNKKDRSRMEEIRVFFPKNMEEGIRFSLDHTQKGKICLLSSAAPSFGFFKDYRERGESYKKYAKELSRSCKNSKK